MQTSTVVALALLTPLALTGCKKDPASEVPAAEVTAPSGQTDNPEAPAEGNEQAAENTNAGAEQITISSELSRITFVGSNNTHVNEGHFEGFTGTANLTGDDLTSLDIDIEIDVSTLQTERGDRLTNHLLDPDFFNVAQFPTATFSSTGITANGGDNYTVAGDLTMIGQTHGISFPATITLTDTNLNANSEFSINRQLWGMSYTGMQDNLIRDEVVIRLDIQAAR